jgi:transposase-like protein
MDLVTVFKKFPSQKECIEYLERVRWGDAPICPYCGSSRSTALKNEQRYHCNSCNTTYSVTVNTVFHDTRLELQKWFLAIAIILNAKKGISARQLARDLKVNKNTAWYLGMRIRKAMVDTDQRQLLMGLVEMDETYIGGKPRKGTGKHKRGRGTSKTPVVGMAERGGSIRAKVVRRGGLTINHLNSLVRENVDLSNTTMITDEFRGYIGLSKFVPHKTVNHQYEYVNGLVHTNTVESFWSLLKRGIIGQYHKVSVHYLPRYIDEFMYRFNHRNHEDLFGYTIARCLGIIQ